MNTTKQSKQRTLAQNAALHLYFTLVAERLSGAGYSVQTVISHQLEVDWSPTLVKELIWKRAQAVKLGKRSTTQLTTKEIDDIYDEVNRYLAKFGITEPFPSLESLMWQAGLNKNETSN